MAEKFIIFVCLLKVSIEENLAMEAQGVYIDFGVEPDAATIAKLLNNTSWM